MSTLVLEKLVNDTNNIITVPCVTVIEPTMFSLQGDGTATIKFNGTFVAVLSQSNRTYEVSAAGDYCIEINGQCPAASVYTDLILAAVAVDPSTLQDELAYAETITLAAVNDLVTIPAHIWRSYGLYVKSGEVLVSTDGGSTFPATYDDTDVPVMWGQGNSDELDVTQIVIKASIVPAVLQIIGDYV